MRLEVQKYLVCPNKMAEDGISFMLRIHNEEGTLEQSVRSLTEHLTIPYEIVMILHRCTDRSAEIATRLAEEFATIRIYTYTVQISRAGYETLATDASSSHSLPTYYNWCRTLCSMKWIFKWDADFVASPGLVGFLNNREWLASSQPECIRMTAVNADMKNSEIYLSSCFLAYHKFWYWEIPMYMRGFKETIAPVDAEIHHLSLLANMKPYWRSPPWFATEDSEEARQVRERYERLVADYGPEPIGMARASDPACNSPFWAMKRKPPTYVNPTA
jgi:hypothetical protein